MSTTTLLQLVQQATGELGLSVPTTVVSNTNTDVIQIYRLANACGYEMQRKYQWQGLTNEFRFSTVYSTFSGTMTNGSNLVTGFTPTGGSNSVAALFSGSSGDYLSTPSAAANQITGAIDIIAYIQSSDYTNTTQTIVSKNSGSPQVAYEFRIQASTGLQFVWSTGGSQTASASSTTTIPVANNVGLWVRVTGVPSIAVAFYTSQDSVSTAPQNVSWTQLGSAVSVVSSIFASTAEVEIGSELGGTALNFLGNIYRVYIFSGIGGTLKVSFNASYVAMNASSWTSTDTGETWTKHGNTFLTTLVTPVSDFAITGTGPQQDIYLTVYNPVASTAVISLPATATATGTFTLTQTKYSLPADFDRLIDRTDWDKSQHWEMLGPETAQQWQWLKSGFISTGPRIRFRPLGNFFQIWPAIGASHVLGFEYVSKYWAASSSGVPQASFLADTDTCIFNDRLMVLFLKLKYFEIKGFDTTALMRDFVAELDLAKANDAGSQTLSMNPRINTILIGWENIPDSNFGS